MGTRFRWQQTGLSFPLSAITLVRGPFDKSRNYIPWGVWVTQSDS